MSSEKDDGLRGLLRRHIPHWHWQAMENWNLGAFSGVPDSNYCHGGVEGWIECKRTDAWAVRLEVAQVGWLMRRAAEGGRCTIAVRRRHCGGPRRGAPVDELWLVDGCAAHELSSGGLQHLNGHRVLLLCTRGPTEWNWTLVERVLKRRV